jgi:hypothetical protein
MSEQLADIRTRVSPLVLGGLAVAVAILAIAVATALSGGGRTVHTQASQPIGVGAATPVVAAPGPPPGCSSITNTPRRSRITVAQFDRRVWCERWHATPNSSIYQFVGVP